MKSWNEIRKAATAFSKRWKNAYDEKSQAQSFLKEFFAVFGVDTVVFNAFEHRVKFTDGSQGYADCFWQGKILVEMKSAGKDLDAAYPGATLADLYDPRTMPPDLVKAHAHLDALVDKAYGLSPSCTDADRVAHLFKLYAEMTKEGK